jgi:hypothetical protein
MFFQMCVVHTKLDTVKPAKVVTFVKQPPVLKGHLFHNLLQANVTLADVGHLAILRGWPSRFLAPKDL